MINVWFLGDSSKLSPGNAVYRELENVTEVIHGIDFLLVKTADLFYTCKALNGDKDCLLNDAATIFQANKSFANSPTTVTITIDFYDTAADDYFFTVEIIDFIMAV